MSDQVQLQPICQCIYAKAVEYLSKYSKSLLGGVSPCVSRPCEYITKGSDISIVVWGKWEELSKDNLKEFQDYISNLCAELESEYQIKISINFWNKETLQHKRFGACFNECENSETKSKDS